MSAEIQRVEAAEAALRSWETASPGCPLMLWHVLADLMHWCDAQGIAFDDALALARRHYQDELR